MYSSTDYSFRSFYAAGTAEQVARGQFYSAAMDAATAQRASRRADSKLLYAALCWAATMPDIPACPEELRAWGPDAPEAIPDEPPSGKTGKAASAYFRQILGFLPNWPRTADGSPVGPESVTRRPSEATVAFLSGLPEDEAAAIKALASAAVRFGDRTRQAKAKASGSRKAKAEGDAASGDRKAESTEGASASGPAKPDLSGLNAAERAAVLIQYALACAEALVSAADEAELATFGYAEEVKTEEANEAHAALNALKRKAEAALSAAKLAADRATASGNRKAKEAEAEASK